MKQFSLEEYLKDPSREVVTRSGKKARIICTDRHHPVYKVVALVPQSKLFDDGNEVPISYSAEGKVYASFEDDPKTPNDDDLFFSPEKKSRWVCLYRGEESRVVYASPAYSTREIAECFMKRYDGFALTEITWEE